MGLHKTMRAIIVSGTALAATMVHGQPRQAQQTPTQVPRQTAVSTNAVTNQQGRGLGWFYTDADGDGVCDNIGKFVGRNSQAVRQGTGMGTGRGARGRRAVLTTAAETGNSSGASANGATTVATQSTVPQGTTARQIIGHGRFYADVDGDGVCDNLGMRVGQNARPTLTSGRQGRGRNRITTP